MIHRLGLDSNVLIYAHLSGFPAHRPVRRYLSERLATEDTILALTPLVLHEFVHVVTDARRFEPPVTMSDALTISRVYLKRENVECLATDEAALLRALKLLDKHRLGRKRIADTLLAATMLEHGVNELVTCNPRDFGIFQELNVIDPR